LLEVCFLCCSARPLSKDSARCAYLFLWPLKDESPDPAGVVKHGLSVGPSPIPTRQRPGRIFPSAFKTVSNIAYRSQTCPKPSLRQTMSHQRLAVVEEKVLSATARRVDSQDVARRVGECSAAAANKLALVERIGISFVNSLYSIPPIRGLFSAACVLLLSCKFANGHLHPP